MTPTFDHRLLLVHAHPDDECINQGATMAKYIAEDGMSQEEAAQKWIADNPDKVDAWIS